MSRLTSALCAISVIAINSITTQVSAFCGACDDSSTGDKAASKRKEDPYSYFSEDSIASSVTVYDDSLEEEEDKYMKKARRDLEKLGGKKRGKKGKSYDSTSEEHSEEDSEDSVSDEDESEDSEDEHSGDSTDEGINELLSEQKQGTKLPKPSADGANKLPAGFQNGINGLPTELQGLAQMLSQMAGTQEGGLVGQDECQPDNPISAYFGLLKIGSKYLDKYCNANFAKYKKESQLRKPKSESESASDSDSESEVDIQSKNLAMHKCSSAMIDKITKVVTDNKTSARKKTALLAQVLTGGDADLSAQMFQSAAADEIVGIQKELSALKLTDENYAFLAKMTFLRPDSGLPEQEKQAVVQEVMQEFMKMMGLDQFSQIFSQATQAQQSQRSSGPKESKQKAEASESCSDEHEAEDSQKSQPQDLDDMMSSLLGGDKGQMEELIKSMQPAMDQMFGSNSKKEKKSSSKSGKKGQDGTQGPDYGGLGDLGEMLSKMGDLGDFNEFSDGFEAAMAGEGHQEADSHSSKGEKSSTKKSSKRSKLDGTPREIYKAHEMEEKEAGFRGKKSGSKARGGA